MTFPSPTQISLVNNTTGDVYAVSDARMYSDMHGHTKVEVSALFASQNFKGTDPSELELRLEDGSHTHQIPLRDWRMESDFASDMLTVSATGTFDSSGVTLIPGSGGYVDFEFTPTFEWSEQKVRVPPGMTVEEAVQILTTCVVCEKPAPGMCEVCLEAVREARKLMVARWLMEMKEYEGAQSG